MIDNRAETRRIHGETGMKITTEDDLEVRGSIRKEHEYA